LLELRHREQRGSAVLSRLGASLRLSCPACGASYERGHAFCEECGAKLGGAPAPVVADREAPAAERRLVSVLFADLVGFTTLSESRDSEEVREPLSAYFERCKQLIERYGGTVEKFIGDAVMAVWGSPVAKEDDAELAVRAALDLVNAVTELDPQLRARAGVLTGEAAVTIGVEGQGMVAGDLVNTASRIQSAAEPGTVLVGEATKRATEAAIAYDDAGAHQLKGKAEPLQLFRALRVIASRAGALRSAGLEPPFVGRERELRLVKELFHASADERRTQLVSVVGIAGIGKSRLSWEFEKYQDGLAEEAWWHRGRCLSYGEGVAYWALAEMVRMRCRIAEDEKPSSAREKLRATLAEYLPDPDERARVEPRLAHLLGLEEGVAGDQENLFSAWRVLFERLAEIGPVVLVFEDMQWADAGLLAFLDYLLDWSRNHPIFVLALARPDLAERHPTWTAGKRAVTSLYLEPLSAQAMEELLSGLVPGLPEDLRARILDRAEGVPLYAVETVRMLLDRGLLVQDGNVFRPTGSVETLEVPETLHALVAARLDGLTPEERRLVQDGSVLGKTFTMHGLSALTGLSADDLEPLLASLLRKEVLSIQADPRSPERGQYSFLQDIVRHVAYETISKRDRKEKHLAAARHLSSVWSAEEDEIVEVVAAHYLDAYHAAPEAPDADEIRDTARAMLVRAAERAASLGANAEAQRAFERALELTEKPPDQAELHERAGITAAAGARTEPAAAHFERAMELFEAGGASHEAARVSARLAEIMWDRGRLEDGLESMDRALGALSLEKPDADLAALAAQVGRFMYFAGQTELALQRIETALDIAEGLALPEVLSQALNTKGIIFRARGRHYEGDSLLRIALDIALDHDKPSAAMRAYYNLADNTSQSDRNAEAAELVRDGLALARRVGNRYWEMAFLGLSYPLFALGDWDEVLARQNELSGEDWLQSRLAFATLLTAVVPVKVHRGRLDEAVHDVDRLAELESSADVQERAQHHCAKAKLLFAQGETSEALRFAESALEGRSSMGIAYEAVKEAFVVALECALALSDLDRAEDWLALVEELPPGHSPQFLQAHSSRFRALLAARRADSERSDELFKGAAALFRELAVPFYLAVSRLEHGEWLVAESRAAEAEPLLAEAREIFELARGDALDRAGSSGHRRWTRNRGCRLGGHALRIFRYRQRTPRDRRGVDQRGGRAPVGREAIEQRLEIVHRADVELEKEAILAGDAMAFDHLRALAHELADLLELARRRGNPDDRGQRIADPPRVDCGVIAGDHAVSLEPLHALGNRRRGKLHAASELGHGQPAVHL
jgi:predicted ATPase/class 3 adenylate cyclase